MRFPDAFLDEIRARLPVSDVVRRRVQLKKQGREWRGLSPFNKERTPSFFVNDQKGFYHDFSSGKHGDIFGFVMDTEGVTFPEAVERLPPPGGGAFPGAGGGARPQGGSRGPQDVGGGRRAGASPPHPARRDGARRKILR